jgi:hypothetical protein
LPGDSPGARSPGPRRHLTSWRMARCEVCGNDYGCRRQELGRRGRLPGARWLRTGRFLRLGRRYDRGCDGEGRGWAMEASRRVASSPSIRCAGSLASSPRRTGVSAVDRRGSGPNPRRPVRRCTSRAGVPRRLTTNQKGPSRVGGALCHQAERCALPTLSTMPTLPSARAQCAPQYQ